MVGLAGEERKDTPDPPCKAVGDPMDSMVNGNHPCTRTTLSWPGTLGEVEGLEQLGAGKVDSANQ